MAVARLDFVEYQVRTSRNYPDSEWMRFLCGGLEHQIEHHLFPSLPRHVLRRAAPTVRAFCQARGLPYVCQPLGSTLDAVLRAHCLPRSELDLE